jgi:hypothetical protein
MQYEKTRKQRWRTRVGRVFDVNPRIGLDAETVWITRKDEATIAEAFERPHTHVCVDGPSGSGKTSLALTFLEGGGIPYAYVPLTRHTTWADACKELLLPAKHVKKTASAGLEVGFDGPIPMGRFRIAFGIESDPDHAEELANERARRWTQHDVARHLIDANAMLVVDNFEFAGDELVNQIAGLARLLGQPGAPGYAKLLVIGTGDVFFRLIAGEESLRDRVGEVTVGTLPDHGMAWDFLIKGFEKLSLFHPANSRLQTEREKLRQCIRAVFEAADGLPKTLNFLGAEIARAAYGSTGVSAAVILEQSRRLAQSKWDECLSRPPRWLEALEANGNAMEVVRWLYRTGLGGIYHTLSITRGLREALPRELVLSAIELLTSTGFLTRTGLSGSVVFVADIAVAHLVGVALSNPGQFDGVDELLQRSKQLSLPLYAGGPLLTSG